MDGNASINPALSVEDSFRTILWADLATMARWRPVAYAGKDIEGVHQMRVGLRRMRSALTVFRPALPRKISSPWAADMRWTGKQLDRARDLDVYISESLPAKAKGRERRLSALAEAQREKAYAGVKRTIKGKRFKHFGRDFALWIADRAWREKLSEHGLAALDEPVPPFAAAVLEGRLAKVLSLGEEIRDLDQRSLHDLRIECKKFRYAAEFFVSLFGEDMKAYCGHLEAVQDLLGMIDDTSVMSGLHERLLAGNGNRRLARAARELEKQRATQARRVTREFETRWRASVEDPCPWRGCLVGGEPTSLAS